MSIAQLEADLKAKSAEGLALIAKYAKAAEADNRVLTDQERGEIDAISQAAHAIEARIAKAKGDQEMIAELERLHGLASPAGGGGHAGNGRRLSLGQQFVASVAGEFHRKFGHRAQAAWRSPSVELFLPEFRGATLTEDPASGGALVRPEYLPGIRPLDFPPVAVPQLFSQGTTGSNSISYMREKTFTNAAATVKEGELKPESTLVFEAATSPVRKIAHWLPTTEELLEDEPAIRSYIDARLRLGVEIEEEDQVLNGSGTDPDLLGINNTPGLATPVAVGVAPATVFDAILTQMMAIYAGSFLMPDALVMHPSDWGQAILSKDTTGRYLTPGPFSPVQTPTMWGLTVVPTPRQVANTVLVGAFKMGGQIFRRGGIRVETSNSHADFFVKNLVAIRAEERLAFVVYRPAAFGKVTGA